MAKRKFTPLQTTNPLILKRRPQKPGNPKEGTKYEELGRILRRAKVKKGVFGHAIAREIGVSTGLIGHWELGISAPSPRLIAKVAEAYGVDLRLIVNIIIEERIRRLKENFLKEMKYEGLTWL